MGKKKTLKCKWMQLSNTGWKGTAHIDLDAYSIFSLIFFWEGSSLSCSRISYWFSQLPVSLLFHKEQ